MKKIGKIVLGGGCLMTIICIALMLICNQMEQQGQVSVSPNKEERLKIDNYEEVYISNTLDYCNRSCFVFFTFLVYWN